MAGPVCVRRPAPAALNPRRLSPEGWAGADAMFIRTADGDDAWESATPAAPETWTCDLGLFRLELRRSSIGHIGIFPEQQPNWRRLRTLCGGASRPLSILNAFAYTGASTLACLGADGAHPVHVCHVDGSSGAVSWARRNAALNGWDARPARWIVDDVMTFLRREVKRGHVYDGLVFDPPAFGRGPKKEIWKLERDLAGLMAAARQLLSEKPAFILLTAHAPGMDAGHLAASLDPLPDGQTETMTLDLAAESGAVLPAGYGVLRTW
mgnify:FL=1